MATRQLYPLHVGSLIGTSDEYLPINGRGLPLPTFAQVAHPWAAAAVARHLRVVLDTAPGAGQTRTVQLLVDSGAGPVALLEVTFTEGQTEQAISGTEAIADSAKVCFYHSSTGNPPTTRARLTFTCDYVDDGVSCYGGGGSNEGPGNTGIFSSGGVWSLVGSTFNRTIAPAPGTIDRLLATSSVAVPAGETLSLVISINGSAVDTYTMTEGETSLDEAIEIAFVAGDLLHINTVPSWEETIVVMFGIRVAAEDGVSFLTSRGTTDLAQSATRYTAPRQGSSDSHATESPATVVGGISAFVLRHLYVQAQARNLSVSPITFTVRINGSSTGLAVVTPSLTVHTTAQVSDLDEAITVEPTDRLAMQFITGTKFFQGLLSFAAVVEAFASLDDEEEEPGDDDLLGVPGPLRWVELLWEVPGT